VTPIRELAARVRRREVGARELVAESLRRIDTLDPDLCAVVALRSGEALEEARALDARLASGGEAGPLAGLPMLVKDMTDVAGMRTTFGSVAFADAPLATADHLVVRRLRAAGAIVVGKTNLPEFAAEGFTANALFGPTRNPWNLERTPGGSSGGSAAALAAGLAAIATATDGGGSIRIPACYSGLVGLKPTNGTIARDPIPDWIDLSTDGPISMHVDDVALLLDVLRGPSAGDPTAQERPPVVREPTIGRVVTIERWTDFGPLPPEIAAPFSSAVARFTAALGLGEVEPIAPASLFGQDRIDEDWFRLTRAEHAHRFGRAWFDTHEPDLDSARSFLRAGFEVTIEEYLGAVRRRFGYVRAMDELLGADGLVLSPVMAVDAFPAEGPPHATGPENYVCAAQNLTGHPAISLPAGVYPSGVPFGLQVTAPRFREDLLLAVAARWEEAEPWPLAAPGYAPFNG
jgi:Asp-tRNA(Asn)/Glu-tRNA(Gln) amidotransferase A subunit family amidase